VAFFLPLGCSFWLPGILGAEVDDVQDDSWRGRFAVWLYLVARSDGDGMDSALEYILTDACRLLWLRPIVPRT
jgi:hypothetical protein